MIPKAVLTTMLESTIRAPGTTILTLHCIWVGNVIVGEIFAFLNANAQGIKWRFRLVDFLCSPIVKLKHVHRVITRFALYNFTCTHPGILLNLFTFFTTINECLAVNACIANYNLSSTTSNTTIKIKDLVSSTFALCINTNQDILNWLKK